MSNLTDKVKDFGGLGTRVTTTTPAKTDIYKDVNGQVRVANSGVIIAGQPEVLTGTTIITENDRGKTS